MAGHTNIQVRLRYPSLEEFAARYASRFTARGLFLVVRAPSPVGTLARFALLLRDGSLAFSGTGEVNWVQPSPDPRGYFGMVIRFIILDPGSDELLARILAVREGARQDNFDSQEIEEDTMPDEQVDTTPFVSTRLLAAREANKEPATRKLPRQPGPAPSPHAARPGEPARPIHPALEETELVDDEADAPTERNPKLRARILAEAPTHKLAALAETPGPSPKAAPAKTEVDPAPPRAPMTVSPRRTTLIFHRNRADDIRLVDEDEEEESALLAEEDDLSESDTRTGRLRPLQEALKEEIARAARDLTPTLVPLVPDPDPEPAPPAALEAQAEALPAPQPAPAESTLIPERDQDDTARQLALRLAGEHELVLQPAEGNEPPTKIRIVLRPIPDAADEQEEEMRLLAQECGLADLDALVEWAHGAIQNVSRDPAFIERELMALAIAAKVGA